MIGLIGAVAPIPDNASDRGGQPTVNTISVSIRSHFVVMAKGRVGHQGQPGDFIVDTGTAPTMINARVARELGLETKAGPMIALGNLAAAQTAVLPELVLGPIRAFSLPVQVQDLTAWERKLEIPIAGIIGMDVLARASFSLVYDKRELQFGAVNEGGIPVSLDAQSGLPVVVGKVEGRAMRLLVDTGTDRVVLFGGNPKTIAGLALQNTTFEGFGVTGAMVSVRLFYAADIELGGRHFSVAKGYVVPGAIASGLDGLLGVRALSFRAIGYDQSRAVMYLR